jgi:hypothetical protein
MRPWALLVVLLIATPARAFVLSEDELAETSTELGFMVRGFTFTLTGPTLRHPYIPLPDHDENPTGLGLFDLRTTFSHRRPWLKVVVHNQLSLLVRSPPPSVNLGQLSFGRGQEPRRWLELEYDLVDHEGYNLRENLDWAFVALSHGPLTLTVGRQPITIGRGKIWKPLDLFATFALTEVDTEYKPGADALRVDWTAAEQTTLSLIASAGVWNSAHNQEDELLTGSALALRGKQVLSFGEVGFLAGLIRRDVVIGLDVVWDLGRFDIYGELALHALFDESLTPAQPEREPIVPRVLLGATFKPTAKLTLSPEVFYNGFGEWDAGDYLGVGLSDRVAMGEMYNLGRVYVAGMALWEVHPLVTVNGGLIINPLDPSGLVSLGLNYSLASNMVLVAGAYIPAGRLPDLRAKPLPAPRSEFGLYPTFVFLELKAAM